MRGGWSVAVLTGLLLLGGIAGGQSPTLPEGCAPTAIGTTCQWTFDTRESPTTIQRDFGIPLYAHMLSTTTVVQDGVDGGWDITLYHDPDATFEEHRHVPAPSTPPSTVARTTFQTLFLGEENDTGILRMTLLEDGVAGSFTGVGFGPPSAGSFTVTFAAEALANGTPPERPAATRADPHLLASPLDARRGAYDILAAWLDDAELGDGLFDAHLAVRDLEDWDWQAGGVSIEPRLSFTVLEETYRMDWSLVARSPAAAHEDVPLGCELFRTPDATTEIPVLTAACGVDWETGEFWALVPERAVGSPGDGARFTDLFAYLKSRQQDANLGYTSTLDVEEDRVTGERYPFALGGPDVWDELNPRLAVPDPVAPAWYQAPLAKENVPDTLQVVGALVAVATFLGGAFFVRRSRRQTRELLARVDALTDAFALDARAGLRALGELEIDFARLHRENRISDAQYQLAAQRLSVAATRLARRAELGLDDGRPG